ncbi:DUF664 domain-containing protein [Actinosynnema sp. NPDC023587]|uniref:mycothiol transferase n=1 Tax=Actinosynnema sp. NPDC023587 TaxID=3154695 RepID=UPI0033FF272D
MEATVPAPSRHDTPPPRTGSGEAEVLRGFLDYLRASIAAKVDGAPEARARTADVVTRYREAVELANQVLDRCTDLGAPVPRPRPGGPAPSVRWALTHLIEETGRHAGHADVIRELIDGAVGR